ncbi:MAG: hypothetical protein WD896_01175 [Parcubacteria group bacterium]
MNKLFNKKIYLFSLVLSAILLPYSVFASNVYLETERTEFFVGDIILVTVKIDSEDKEINTVEGKISLDYLPGAILIRDINLSESSFSLWPGKPSLSDDLRVISFVGGVPSGFGGQNATLFKIALNLTDVGQITLRPEGISVYLNDGKGTRETASVQNLTINVLPQEAGNKPANDLDALISRDKTPPLPFEIVLGQDDSVFEGKKFLSFSTIDEESGLKYYEVREGDLPPTRSSGTYVLQNQNKPTRVIVTAVDGSGNARESVYESKSSYLNLIVIVVLVVLILIALGFVVKKRKKNDSV